MVSKRRLDCDLLGYGGAPVIPKAPRSIRKRSSRKKFPEDGNLFAFELLASVAEKLLEKNESSTSSNVAEEEKAQPFVELYGNNNTRPTSDDKGLISESSFAQQNFEKFDCDKKLGILDIKKDDGSIFVGNSSNDNTIDSEGRVYSDSSKNQTGDFFMANTSHVKDPKQERVNTNTLLNSSENGVQFPLYRGMVSSVDRWRNVQLGSRDDDENSFGGNKFRPKIRSSFRSQPRFMHRGIAKTGSSRFRIAAPKMKDRDPYYNREAMKLFYRYRKNSYGRERYHYTPIRKRKLTYDKSDYRQAASCDSVSNSPNKDLSSTKKIHKKATDSKVKLKIKSFFVPELYIDIAETDTVGSLKRAVMDAVNALLGGGIRVGVVLKGRKCRGDKRTLQRAGISEGSNLNTLGFTLEPKLTRKSPPSKVDNQSPRSALTPVVESGISNVSAEPKPNINVEDENKNSNNNLVPSPQTPPNNESSDNMGSSPDSKALVPFHAVDAEPLTVIPVVNVKPKTSELSQRRTRRPFSVAEVEALVSAVEKLGTGRWRDVKMGAFENADHRTYVDLKDKWKTLVHTASISPQQRRGEPVPQDLLDRVLSAHSYWSQHQSKHHGKNSSNNESPVKMVSFREEVAQA